MEAKAFPVLLRGPKAAAASPKNAVANSSTGSSLGSDLGTTGTGAKVAQASEGAGGAQFPSLQPPPPAPVRKFAEKKKVETAEENPFDFFSQLADDDGDGGGNEGTSLIGKQRDSDDEEGSSLLGRGTDK